MAGGEVHRGERAVVDAQGEAGGVKDVEHVEAVAGAAYEAEHLGDVHGVARSRVGEQLAGLRPLEGVKAAGGVPASSSKTTGSSIPALSKTRFCRAVDCWSVDTRLWIRFAAERALPYGGSDPTCRQTPSAITIGSDWNRAARTPSPRGSSWHPGRMSSFDRFPTLKCRPMGQSVGVEEQGCPE